MDISRLLAAYKAAVIAGAASVEFDGETLPIEHVEEVLETDVRVTYLRCGCCRATADKAHDGPCPTCGAPNEDFQYTES